MIPNRFSNFFAAVVAAILLVGANLDAADLSRARVRDNIVYFLEPSPAQLKRYDMAAQAWLAPLPAPAGATCFDVDTNAIYFGTGQAIIRTDSSGGNAMNLKAVSTAVEDIAVAGRFLVFLQKNESYYSGGYVVSADKSSGSILDLRRHDGWTGRIGVSQTGSVVWIDIVGAIVRFALGTDGALGGMTLGGYSGAEIPRPPLLSREGLRLFVNSPTILREDDLTFLGQFPENYANLATNGSALVASIGSNIVAISRLGNETGRFPLSFEPGLVRVYSTNVFAFGSSLDQIPVVPLAALGAQYPEGPIDYSLANLGVDSIVSDGQGRVFFVDRKLPWIFRWSATSGGWLREIPLAGIPRVLSHDPFGNRLLVGLASGAIQSVDLSQAQPEPVPFGQVSGEIVDLVAAGGPVVAAVAGRPSKLAVFNSAGLNTTNLDASFEPGSFAWDGTRRLLWLRTYSANWFLGIPLSEAGFVTGPWLSRNSYNYSSGSSPSILSPDGALVVGSSGILVNLTNEVSEPSGTLEGAVVDGVWTAQGLHTIRSVAGYARLQRWTGSFVQSAGTFMEGSAIAMFASGTNLLAVTRIGYEIQFSQWTPGLALIDATPVSPAPTNITFSGGLTNGVGDFAIVGSLGLDPGVAEGRTVFQVNSPYLPIAAVGSNLVFRGYRLTPGSNDVFRVTVTATNPRGRIISRSFDIPVFSSPSQRPVVSFERITPSADAFLSREVQFLLKIEPASETSFEVRIGANGNAVWWTDVYANGVGGYSSGSQDVELRSYVSQGQTQAVFSISPAQGIGRDRVLSTKLRLLEDGAYRRASTNSETVFLWRTGFDAYMARRFGPGSLTNSAAAPGADYDGNGIGNYGEYLFATQPGLNPTNIRRVVDTNGVPLLSLEFRRSLPLVGQFDLLVSTNLADWWPALYDEQRVGTSDGNSETVTWTVPVAGRSQVFAKVRGAAYGQLRLPEIEVPSLGIDLVGVPQVAVQLGSDTYESGSLPDERPRFFSSFGKSFWVSRREISQADYIALMTNNPSVNVGTNLPVENVTWTEAAEFCRRLTELEAAAGRLPDGYVFRLPSEAEWEYAARGGGYWPWGSIERTNLTVSAWFAPNSFYVTHPVGRLAPNAYGLQDMLGNVAEWCADWYGPYPTGTVIDRVGPLFGTQRVIRGGNILDSETGIRAAARSSAPPEFRSRLVGFRVVLARPVQ